VEPRLASDVERQARQGLSDIRELLHTTYRSKKPETPVCGLT